MERTLCIPLWSRAIAVKKLPQILPDHDAVRILKEMGETKPPTVLSKNATTMRFSMEDAEKELAAMSSKVSKVIPRSYLETSYFRIKPDPGKVVFHEMDLPEVIEARRSSTPTTTLKDRK